MRNIKILNMDIYITKNYKALSKKAAQLLVSVIKEKEYPILGLATGSTPVGMYAELIAMNRAGEVDFSKTSTYNLDEYYPISKDSKQSYYYFMRENLFKHINIDLNNTHIPDGSAKDSAKESEAFDQKVRDTGGLDMQVLGIGVNGHIAFSEPANDFAAKTQKVTLAKATIERNARFFDNIEDVPTQAITMGIGTIMNSNRIMLLASGSAKAQVIKETILGKVTPQVPASILQFHKDVTIILDEDAASEFLKAINNRE